MDQKALKSVNKYWNTQIILCLKGSTTLSITTFSIMTLCITMFSIIALITMTFSITTLGIMTLSLTIKNMTLSITTFRIMTIMTLIIVLLMSFKLSVENKPFVLCINMLSVVMLNTMAPLREILW